MKSQEHWTIEEMRHSILKDDPLWFKDAIIYEVPVRAFADSNGDGIGDFGGLKDKLDYIQELGVTALWVLPFFPSPLKDDGYDIADYNSVNPIYGNLEDFKEFLRESHKRGIRVIIELIVNHTSDQHPWFQRARKAPPGSPEREFYVWNDNPRKYQAARIIFQDFEHSNWTWDSVANAYYWHRFYSHQPDLNYENPAVQKAVLEVVDFWLEMGVDGLRLDAVPYLYEEEGTNCENLPQTHEFLQALRSHMDSKFPNRMLLAEANQWPEDAAAYFGHGNECHMNFHFPLMPRLFMALKMEDSFPIIDILQQTPQIPNNCQWALFLRNHDELTLEMVSDEDRDYMYRVYAQDPQARINLGIRRRLSPLMDNDRRRIELLNSLLFSLPGTPVLYYGDEIGMGDNIYLGDRNGVRTPMQWSADRNAGFSRTNPQRLYAPPILDPEYHYEAINVEAQRSNTNALWWSMKRLIATRKRFQAFGRGSFEFLYPDNRKVLAFTRTYAGEHILIVSNLSRFVQTVELDLTPFQGMKPVEIFGRTEFPTIEDVPYFLSLSPYAFYWFTLQVEESITPSPVPVTQLPTLDVPTGPWPSAFYQNEPKTRFELHLPNYLITRSWFTGKSRTIQSTQIIDVIPIPYQNREAQILFIQINYTEGAAETYAFSVAYEAISADDPPLHGEHMIAKINVQEAGETGILYEASADPDFLNFMLEAIANGWEYQGIAGKIVPYLFNSPPQLNQGTPSFDPHLLRGEHKHTSIIYSDPHSETDDHHLVLKLFRQIEEGINADLEIGEFLTRRISSEIEPNPKTFSLRSGQITPFYGSLEYRRPGKSSMTIGVLRDFIPDIRDGWSYTLDNLRGYFEQVMATSTEIADLPLPTLKDFTLDVTSKPSDLDPESNDPIAEIPEVVYSLIGSYLGSAESLGQYMAEFHLALASDSENRHFAPEPFSSFYQRSIYQYMRNLSGKTLLFLQKRLNRLPEDWQPIAMDLINRKDQLLKRFSSVIDLKITALRTRCHGDYHLEQVLYTGKEFVITNFEGETNRPLSERRMKRSPLRDVAGMLQSFHYAASVALQQEVDNGMIDPENLAEMEQWADFWCSWVNLVFVKAYLQTASQGNFLPDTPRETQVLLDAYILEKSVYAISYELTRRPTWVKIPLSRTLKLLQVDDMSYLIPLLHSRSALPGNG
ncbi:maltose alpha-D-glucosyltransferase [Roseofilum sp. BLCC_M114]|uniref:Maltokinase n=2 Tax=Roseofilum TaxID=1233426 RepID=A0ABT7B7D0_9CYAN|nr:maltose alpha-D-glucosyltransferase [Roseofilum capinflatum]MDJ1174529.1 maltose alpha-D-glucosyltransferase [Roseofilum capinflatum BLCC-M114]